MIIFKAKWLGGETWVANPTPKSKQQSMKYDRIQHKTQEILVQTVSISPKLNVYFGTGKTLQTVPI